MQRADLRTRVHGVSWPYWVLPLLALGGLLGYMLSSGPQQAAPVATSAGKFIYLTTAPDNWASIGGTLSNDVDRGVYNRGGEKLGTIKDILIGPDGKMAAALINVGRSLGIGHKEIALPFSALQLEQGATSPCIVVDATKNARQSAPTFEQRPGSRNSRR